MPEALGEPDIVIRLDTVPRAGRQATLNEELAIHNRAGAFHIRNGSEIVVDPLPGAPLSAIRSILLGRMMAYLLRQRGWLALHASAARVNGRGVLFLGESGAGKSTTAAALHTTGHRVLTDDIAPVRVSDARCILLPPPPRLRLDANSRPLIMDPPPRNTPEWDDKYLFELPLPGLPEPIAVDRIYLLEYGEDLLSLPVPPIESVRLFSAHSFFRRRRMNADSLSCHLRHCAALANTVTVRRLTRPRQLSALPDLVALIEREVGDA